MNRIVLPGLSAFCVLITAALSQKAIVSSAFARPNAPANKPLVYTREVETNRTALSSIPPQAVPGLRMASERGDARAQAIVGYMLVHGVHVQQDVAQGLKLLRQSADQGFVHAMAELGSLYLRGGPVARDYPEAVRWLKLGAEKGEPRAERDLGVCFQKGYGVETNFSEAARWYLRAAEHTNYIAMKDLGALLVNGTGVAKDYNAAIHWFTRAAEEGGNARAMFNLGMLGENGLLGTNSQAKAIRWYQQSVQLNDPMSCWRLAVCYRYGKGVPQDPGEYLRLMRRAAVEGEAEAQFFLGEAYRLGQGVPPSLALAMSWYRNAATNNYPDACYNLATAHLMDKTNESARAEACRYMLQAADLGHREAQLRCAVESRSGAYLPKDLNQWKTWLERSAEGGWPKAELILWQALTAGWEPFTKNETEAQKWLERAAMHGDFDAQCQLAIKLVQGVQIKKDAAQALKWWRWAAEHGFPTAQNDLGYAIQTGEAEKIDLVEACMWFQLASKAGIERAKVNLKNLSGRLTQAELDEARRRATDFRAKPVPELRPVKTEGDIGTPLLDMSSNR